MGIALTAWLGIGNLAPAHAAPAPATVPDQPPADEEQPLKALAPVAADATTAPHVARPVRGPQDRACRCGPRTSPTL
ncbi:hypothetical protein AB0C52_32045 [Streptomyces sp. NPDC048717]|uniref:hypothetical protein n=1 Tax=Streptomyces sp. NPDC048717 TaxID=3154928 RepID=UPI0034215CE1